MDVQWAYVGDKAGSYLDLKLDTRTSTSRDGAPHAPIVLTHWRGPAGMGQAGALRGLSHIVVTSSETQQTAKPQNRVAATLSQTHIIACGNCCKKA